MMSVLIECGEDAVALGATLATLVPGAIEGLVREVLVVDRGLDALTRKVADHAGCRIVPPDDAVRALRAAKGDWILLIEPGARLSAEWVEAVAEHLAGGGDRSPGAARFSPARSGWLAWLTPGRRRALAHGLILPKAEALRLQSAPARRAPASARLRATIRPRGEGR